VITVSSDRHIFDNCFDKLIGFQGKCILESLPVLGLHFMFHAELVGEDNVVLVWNDVDHQLAVGFGDLSGDVMSMRLGARAIEVCNLSTPELDNADYIVNVGEILQLRMVLKSSGRPAGFRDWVAKIPKGEVDVMDSAVDKNASIASSVSDKEPSFITQITSVGSDHEWSTDGLLLVDLFRGIAIGGVESARKACHDLDGRVTFSSLHHILRLPNV
jgi:hypothetical protein